MTGEIMFTGNIMMQNTDMQIAALFGAGLGIIGFILFGLLLALIVFMIVAMWKTYKKANRKGWEAIIPVWNNYVFMTKMAGRPAYWFWTSLVFSGIAVTLPIVLGETHPTAVLGNGIGNIIALLIAIVVYRDISKRFGKSGWFTVGLILLPFIFFPILAWGKAKFTFKKAKW